MQAEQRGTVVATVARRAVAVEANNVRRGADALGGGEGKDDTDAIERTRAARAAAAAPRIVAIHAVRSSSVRQYKNKLRSPLRISKGKMYLD